MNAAALPKSSTARLDQEPWAGIFETALEHCRREEWELGLAALSQLLSTVRRADLPGHFYSYLGYGMARCNGRVKQGLRLCHRGVQLEFYQPENYVNLARTLLLTDDRRAACDAIARGLAIDPEHEKLLELQRGLGLRKRSPVPFLSRRHLLNRILGRIRHDLWHRSAPDEPQTASQGTTASSS